MPNETDREEIEDEMDREEADEETTEETRAWWLDEGCLLWSRYVIVPVLVALLLGVSAIIVALVVQDILQPGPTPTPTIFFKAVADVPTATPSPTVTPSPTATPPPTATNTPPPPPPCIPAPPGGWSPYLVRRGDTLFSLARRTGTTVTRVQQVNCLPNDHIYAMQELWLPAAAHPSRPGCITYHTVVRGQTLYSIGRMYGVSPMTVATANCICDMNRIYAGQTLCIPALQRPGPCCPCSQ